MDYVCQTSAPHFHNEDFFLARSVALGHQLINHDDMYTELRWQELDLLDAYCGWGGLHRAFRRRGFRSSRFDLVMNGDHDVATLHLGCIYSNAL